LKNTSLNLCEIFSEIFEVKAAIVAKVMLGRLVGNRL